MYIDGKDIPAIEKIKFESNHEIWAWEMFLMIFRDVKQGNQGLMRSVIDYCEFYNISSTESKNAIYEFIRDAMPEPKEQE